MASNKYAVIRYKALDQCFRNPGKRYFIDDLIFECNKAIYNYYGSAEGIQKRQVFEDIRFMESSQGWSIPLERLKDGRKVYYRYSEKSFSINNQIINEVEAKQLKETLLTLARFKGMPQFEWMEEMLVWIESAFDLKGNNKAIVGFEQNRYLKGLHHFSTLFNAIQYKKVVAIKYKGFKQLNSVYLTIHPYFLKQYNSRWFLFGYNEDAKAISNLALDRIDEIKETDSVYVENERVDFEDYFEDVIGVTVKDNKEPEKILLQVNNSIWPYLETKPMHGSQKTKEKTDEYITIELTLQINYELAALIFSFGEGVGVIAPLELREIIKTKAKSLLEKYL